MSTFGRAPAWGSAWKRFIRENADRTNTSYIQKTTLPYNSNYLDLDPVVKDPLGFPVTRITAEYKPNELAIAAFLQDRMARWYREAGAIEVVRSGLGGRWACRPMPTAARGWATTRRPTSSTATGSPTRSPTSASSARRSWAPAGRGIRR